ncbi:MAG: hypothetical protein SGI86_07970 [Deltaproteobacteria bacterium]|nr:hypothetical protein [Deltaproteobacteria bacterium]
MSAKSDSNAINAKRLFLAGFMAILATAVGFAVRGGILADWGAQFGFTGVQLGAIGGAGFSGFCFGIILGGIVVDKLGYGKIVALAFLMHVLSAVITFQATEGQAQDVAYKFLFWGTFMFAFGNGSLEAVANPLVATLFPEKRTHYLNILHAAWPLGLVAGGLIGWTMGGAYSWKIQLGLFLVPTLLYGVMFVGQKMPKSEASQKGLSMGEMFKDVGLGGGLIACALLALFFGGAVGLPPAAAYGLAGLLLVAVGVITNFSTGSWLMFVLFVVHAMVGSVELGTDGWIQNITGNILTPSQGKILFVFTSIVMFSLRFTADFIERKLKLSPIGILLVCSVLACVGLNLVSRIDTFAGAFLALTVYALGKTFFWPTMLAVVGDRFPASGAIAMSIMGGVGMMSAGMLGSPGLGYAKDRFAGEALEQKDAALHAQYKAETPSSFLFFSEVFGIDGKKLGAVQGKLAEARTDASKAGNEDPKAAFTKLSPDENTVYGASIEGDRRTLVADSFIPAVMAVIYLLLFIYFKAIGGYKTVSIAQSTKPVDLPTTVP